MIGTPQHIYATLSVDETVTALVSDRIYPQRRAEGATIPCVVYSVISVQPARQFAGPWQSEWERVQVDCYAPTYAAAATLASTVDAVLETAPATTYGSLQVGAMRRISGHEEDIDHVDGSDRAIHVVHTDYLSTVRKV